MYIYICHSIYYFDWKFRGCESAFYLLINPLILFLLMKDTPRLDED